MPAQKHQHLPVAAIEKIRAIAGNEKCMDCGSAEPDWGDVLHGSLHCIQCAGLHRGLGVSVSFCRSLTMDNWTEENLLSMLLGGNRQLKAFFTRQRIANSSVDVLYRSRPAAFYREQLAKQVHQLLAKRKQRGRFPDRAWAVSSARTSREQDPEHDDDTTTTATTTTTTTAAAAAAATEDDENPTPRRTASSSSEDDDDDDELGRSRRSQRGEEEVKYEKEKAPSPRARSAPAPQARRRSEVLDFDAEVAEVELGASLTRALPPPGWSCPGKSMALVTKVRSTGAAAKAGLRVGDYVVAMNGRAVVDYDEFVSLFPRTPRPTRLTVRRFRTVLAPETEDEVVTVDFGTDEAPLGFSIERDRSSGRARVSRVAPGGRAASLGVKVDDVVTTLNGRDVLSYDVVVETLPSLQKPIVAGLLRRRTPPPPSASSSSSSSDDRPSLLGGSSSRPKLALASRPPSSTSAGLFGARLTSSTNRLSDLYDDERDEEDDVFFTTHGTKKLLEPRVADEREFDVEFDDGPLGMRIEERVGLVPVTVVTSVDPRGQAFRAGVRVGCTVQGLNGEKYLSHAHAAATLRHGKRPLTARLRHAD